MPPARSLPPIANPNAQILILGSMPGAASLEAGQYYAHPRNAFWVIMGELFGARLDLPYDSRCQILRQAGVAVWDVLRECEREGSLDTRIDRQSEVANDLAGLLAKSPMITTIVFNGTKAEAAFRRHVLPTLGATMIARLRLERLPSTSPAHASRTTAEKLDIWRAALL